MVLYLHLLQPLHLSTFGQPAAYSHRNLSLSGCCMISLLVPNDVPFHLHRMLLVFLPGGQPSPNVWWGTTTP